MTTPEPVLTDTVVAVVPAKDRADRVAATVRALRALPRVHRVLVVDDGSGDDTAAVARAAGSEVLRLPRNQGKAGAVLAGVRVAPEADVFLLIDADLGDTAADADLLLDPVLAGDADMSIGVLPSAGTKGGLGLVKSAAARGIRRACGQETTAPLSGQRAVRAGVLRSLADVRRFGLEVALTVDAKRAGARIVEVPVPMDHLHTGRTPAGFGHRARQGIDVVSALWPRLTAPRQRIAIIIVVGLVLTAGMAWSSAEIRAGSAPPTDQADKVVIFGVPRLGLDDLTRQRMPNLTRLADEGAVSVNSVRTLPSQPTTAEAYVALGAGVRVDAPSQVNDARMAASPVEGGSADQVVERRIAREITGEVVVMGGPQAIAAAEEDDVSSAPGAFGEALNDAGKTTAVIGNGDTIGLDGGHFINRPAAVAVMNQAASVDFGNVTGDVGDGSLSTSLLMRDPDAPYGIRANPEVVVEEVQEAERRADVVVVDPGDTDRAGQYSAITAPEAAEELRLRALRHTDDIIGRVADTLPEDTLLLVVSVSAPEGDWALTPMVAYGTGVREGYLYSPSTNRLGLTTITDIAPTVLDQLGVDTPTGMVGAPLRYHEGDGDLAPLEDMNDDAASREVVYSGLSTTFIVVQALAYAIIILILHQGAKPSVVTRFAHFAVLAFAAWPLATFVYRALPSSLHLGSAGQVVVWGIAALVAAAAGRLRSRPLLPMHVICGATVALILVDVASGAELQMSSILGYSPHSAARYTGIGNTAFAVLAAAAVIAGMLHVQFASRRREALVTTAVLFFVVVVTAGWPSLGADFGGVLTLMPVFGICLLVLAGRRIRPRTIVWAGVATALVVALMVGVDLLRAAESRTHLGRFVTDAFDDSSTFWTTIARKWDTNVRVFRSSVWTWMVPITAAFLVYVLVISRGWERLLPRRSAARMAVVGLILVGALGWLVNDSGVVVTALAFVFMGPFITLLAFSDAEDGPELLPPLPTPQPEAPIPEAVYA